MFLPWAWHQNHSPRDSLLLAQSSPDPHEREDSVAKCLSPVGFGSREEQRVAAVSHGASHSGPQLRGARLVYVRMLTTVWLVRLPVVLRYELPRHESRSDSGLRLEFWTCGTRSP